MCDIIDHDWVKLHQDKVKLDHEKVLDHKRVKIDHDKVETLS